MLPNPVDLTRRTSWEIRDAIAAGQTTAIINLGAHEQHGPHLPLATDAMWGTRIAEMIAERIGGAFVAPTIAVGISPHHMSFAGTITLRISTWAAVIEDYVTSLEHHGFTRIIFVPSHGGNFNPLIAELPGLRERHPAITFVAFTDLLGLMDVAGEVAARYGLTVDEAGGHAGELETSLILALEPDTVHMDLAEVGYVGPLEPVIPKLQAGGMEAVTSNGILGDATKGDVEHGHAYFARLLDMFVDHLN